MMRSGESLDYVVDCILNDKAIKSNNGGPSLPQRGRSISPVGYQQLNSFSDAKKTSSPQNHSAMIRRKIYQKKYRDISPNNLLGNRKEQVDISMESGPPQSQKGGLRSGYPSGKFGSKYSMN